MLTKLEATTTSPPTYMNMAGVLRSTSVVLPTAKVSTKRLLVTNTT